MELDLVIVSNNFGLQIFLVNNCLLIHLIMMNFVVEQRHLRILQLNLLEI